MNIKKIQVVILAAGKGKRMRNENTPKALIPFKGRPMINHVLDAVKKSMVCQQPVIVTGHLSEKVKQELGPKFRYVIQSEQLGTGHAVACTKKILKNKGDHILVLPCDKPYISHQTIKKIADEHLTGSWIITMPTITVSDFSEWRAILYDHGRIIRNDYGEIYKTIEKKDATPEELEINELGAGIYCFQADWMWQNIDQLRPDNAQKEYYLTDLLRIAFQQNHKIGIVPIEPHEGLGINSLEQLKIISHINFD